MRSFVCAFERTFASLKRDLFFLRAQFLQNVVASPPSFLSKFLPTANKLEKKRTTTTKGDEMILHILWWFYARVFVKHTFETRTAATCARAGGFRSSFRKRRRRNRPWKTSFFCTKRAFESFWIKRMKVLTQYVFFSLSGVRVRSRREYKSLQT